MSLVLRVQGPLSAFERWAWHELHVALMLAPREPITVRWSATPPHGDAVHLPRATWSTPSEQVLAETYASRDIPADGGALTQDLVRLYGWLLSRREESDSDARDAFGRFPVAASAAYRLGRVHEPLADVLVQRVRTAILRHAEARGMVVDTLSPWPDSRRFAVALTHDVDHAAGRSLREAAYKAMTAGYAVARGEWATAWRRSQQSIAHLIGGRATPLALLQALAEVERRRDARSAFFLLPHRRARVSEAGAMIRRYDVGNPALGRVLRRLAGGGWEFGLHVSFQALEQPGLLATEWEGLRAAVGPAVPLSGVRHHYLRFVVPDVWRELASIDARYQSNLGWGVAGFRAGTTWPFFPFDWKSERAFERFELPLHFMDSEYLARGEEALFAAARDTLETVAAHGGCACLLFHNAADDLGPPRFLRVYERVLDEARARGAWLATPMAVVQAMAAHREKFPAVIESG